MLQTDNFLLWVLKIFSETTSHDPASVDGYLLSSVLPPILTPSRQRGNNQQPGNNRITRTSSKNIMPVLDTVHLLACPRDMQNIEGEGEERWRRRQGEREGAQAGIKGSLRRS